MNHIKKAVDNPDESLIVVDDGAAKAIHTLTELGVTECDSMMLFLINYGPDLMKECATELSIAVSMGKIKTTATASFGGNVE